MAVGNKYSAVMDFERGIANGIATLGSDGILAEAQRPTTAQLGAADRVVPAAAGNLAALAAGGNLADSGKKAMDFATRIDLTGQVQLASYRRSVIAFCKTSAANVEMNSYSVGILSFHRVNGLTGIAVCDLAIESQYQGNGYINVNVISNLPGLSDAIYRITPCTFTYKGVSYGGLDIYIAEAQLGTVEFIGNTNFEIFGLDYYQEPYSGNDAVVLNEEVYNSLDYTKITRNHSSQYLNGKRMLTRDDVQGFYPYGRQITESWTDLQTRIKAGNFANISIGDYKTVTLTTGEVVVMEVTGIDQYYRCSDQNTGHHLDMISRDCLATAIQYNPTNTNNGTEAEPNPYRASALFAALNDETSGVYTTLPDDLKACIIEKRALLESRYSATNGALTEASGWAWNNMGKLWLPSEVEVFGCHHWSTPGYGTGGGGWNLQYPIFTGGAKHIIKGAGNGGGRCSWWLASASRLNATTFCYATGPGHAGYSAATNTGARVPLCFRIG